MTKLFGTDGIRGKANSDLTCEIAFRLGQAAVIFKGKEVLIGKDTRVSGDMLESALAAGINSVGGNAHLVGVVPTPAVAYLVRTGEFDTGVMISASHNPPEYNGLKMFDGSGLKLNDAEEEKIEKFILNDNNSVDHLVSGDCVGRVEKFSDGKDRYVSYIVDSIRSQKIDFSDLKIALDTGHGASCDTSFEALTRLGANIVSINRDLEGKSINVRCGSTHLDPLKQLVIESDADVGIAHDGDADRVVMVSREGLEIDGDVILSILALDLKKRGELRNNTVVGTVMTNMGLKKALSDNDIDFVSTKVGDRYVLEEMLRSDYILGGEQSGHIIMLEHNTTGDGLMSAVQFLAAIKRLNKSVDQAISFFKRYPQVLINVAVEDREAALKDDCLLAEVENAKQSLGQDGRVLLRPSGTEPLIRVMVEAQDESICKYWANRIAEKLK